MADEDFFSLYLRYTEQTECPTFFHRWTAIASLSAYLGRNILFRHGHFTLYPNLYTMLIGSPGTKKSSAIKIGAKLLAQAGYDTFAAKKTRQEKFLLDLAEQSEKKAAQQEGNQGYDILDHNLWGDDPDSASNYTNKPPAEVFVAADEFNNFIGLGNTDFISILGELWDYDGVYDYKLKNSKSVYIPNPTITILGGNTATGFSQAFPIETIGQGFFSRLILVYGEPSGVKYTFPPPPDLEIQAELIQILHRIKETMIGEVKMTPAAMALLDKIYKSWSGLDDVRFSHYTNRRLTHLIKLCLTVTASRISMSIDKDDVIQANTILSFTEQLMPKALGEFGKSKNADVTHKIMEALDNTSRPLSIKDLWKMVVNDLEGRNQLVEIVANLTFAGKIQVAGEGHTAGYLPIKEIKAQALEGSVDWDKYLTKNERGLL